MSHSILLPSKPRVVKEEGNTGIYEIDGLYPGYGHTLGNSLRRIILSSIPGAAITSLKIDGVSHEFSTLPGIEEDVITLLLNLQKIRFRLFSEEAQKITLSVKGAREVTAKDLKCPSQVEVVNTDQHITNLTGKEASLVIEMTIEKGLGYVPKEAHYKEKVEVGTIALDASFTPIKRANYEVENMRVGDRTDHNRLRLFIETDGTVSPRETLEHSIGLMIKQLQAVVGFKETAIETKESSEEKAESVQKEEVDLGKVKVEELSLSTRTLNALTEASIKSLAGLARKKEEDLLELEGLGEKGIQEIKRALSNYGLTLK